MSDQPWQGDAVSLVEAFRRGDRHPSEELEATLAAVEASRLNAVCHVDAEAARRVAASANVSLPFGGVPMGVKELDHVAGWPHTYASVPLKGATSSFDCTAVARLRGAGAVLAVQTTSSEFGATNQTTTPLHGTTRNPWQPQRTPGGSSGGSAAGVSGGLFSVATGGDGGGSIRIPAGFCGLFGLKATYGRIPRGPHVGLGNFTSVVGCLSRSVRDTARWFDVCNGFHPRDPWSLPRVEGWERALGSFHDQVRGRRVAILPDLGGAVVADETVELVTAAAEQLVRDCGLRRVDVALQLPEPGAVWGLTGAVGTRRRLGELWPDCAPEMTSPVRHGVRTAAERLDLGAMVEAEALRDELQEAMADLFDQADLVIAASNPDVAFPAEGRLPTSFGGREAAASNNGRLTIPANLYGNPAMSIPVGTGAAWLPIGMQVMAPHHGEQLLLDVALAVERERPWPLVCPGAPH
jgi:Asp-tRNA(Asn)/Glu-tRNA(Gln) amidotransferase A subunit family amidase